jgi:type IV secretory pathway TraG/TraD family ATPase VirD4
MKKVEVKHEKAGYSKIFKIILWVIGVSIILPFLPPKWVTLLILGGLGYVCYNYIIKPILIKNNTIKNVVSSVSPQFQKGNELEFSINGKTDIENPFAGIFICGGAGSGKSKSLIEPLIKEAGRKSYTGVIYDFKFPELAQYAETAYKNSDVTPYYFNFTDLTRSHRINPIAPELMRNESFAREFAFTILANLNPSMISKPDFWSDNATSLLSAVFWYLREKYPNYCTLPHAISMILQPKTTALLMELSSVPKCADMISPILTAYENKADDQLAGVISSLQVSLSKINIDELYYLMTANDFSLELNNPESKGILTIGNDPTLSSTYAPIIGLILTSISKQLNRAGKEKSVFMIDEFPTVYIPNVEQLPATARSNKVATILACQDIAQLTDRYGREKAETVLSNLGNQFYGRTPNPATAKRVSELFGKTDKDVVSYNNEVGVIMNIQKSRTHSTRETDFVKLQEVAQLQTGSFYTILSEGKIKQGLSTIPMDGNFRKSEILPFSHADERDIKNAYNSVKLDVSEVILKTAISLT